MGIHSINKRGRGWQLSRTLGLSGVWRGMVSGYRLQITDYRLQVMGNRWGEEMKRMRGRPSGCNITHRLWLQQREPRTNTTPDDTKFTLSECCQLSTTTSLSHFFSSPFPPPPLILTSCIHHLPILVLIWNNSSTFGDFVVFVVYVETLFWRIQQIMPRVVF